MFYHHCCVRSVNLTAPIQFICDTTKIFRETEKYLVRRCKNICDVRRGGGHGHPGGGGAQELRPGLAQGGGPQELQHDHPQGAHLRSAR